jgi:MFS family permease
VGARGVLALAMALALADTSIVTLALPQVESDLHTGVTGVAAVLFVYAAVLAVVLALASRTAGEGTAGRWAPGGFGLLAVASLACAAADRLDVLLAGRVLQAVGAAAALIGGFALIDGAGRGRRAWKAASILGVAVGPALGGALTQLFDWRAIFIAQAPVALAGAWVTLRSPPVTTAPPREPLRRPRASRTRRAALTSRAALALVTAALSAVLFLVILLVIAGWNVSPLSAAAAVTPLPLAAALAWAIRGPARTRAVAGCALIGAGVLALAWIPQAHLAWIVPPELIAGLGMGCALGALSGELLPERTPRQAAGLLSVRHAAIALVLVVLAPIIASQLDAASHTAELQGVALLLDSPLPPQSKLTLVPELLRIADARQPRASLRAGLADQRHRFTGADRVAFDQLASQADETVLAAVGRSFHLAFVISGVLAFLASALLLVERAPRARSRTERGRRDGGDRAGARRLARAVIPIASLCIAAPVAYASLDHELAPAPVTLGNPCAGGPTPRAAGIGGLAEDGALALLDVAACRLHTSREELVLALTDPSEAARFAVQHPEFDPTTLAKLLVGLLAKS